MTHTHIHTLLLLLRGRGKFDEDVLHVTDHAGNFADYLMRTQLTLYQWVPLNALPLDGKSKQLATASIQIRGPPADNVYQVFFKEDFMILYILHAWTDKSIKFC